MPLSPTLLSTAIFQQLSAQGLSGRDSVNISGAVGTAIARYLMMPNQVTCTLAGTAGPIGSINSTVVTGVLPTPLSGQMMLAPQSVRLTGVDKIRLFNGISIGLCQVLMGMILSGTAVGVALGTGIGLFTNISAQALSGMMLVEMYMRKMIGRDARTLCDSISFGFVQHFRTTVQFTVVVSGVVAPTPPVGPVPVAAIPSLFTIIG